jgi:hypothetical protein
MDKSTAIIIGGGRGCGKSFIDIINRKKLECEMDAANYKSLGKSLSEGILEGMQTNHCTSQGNEMAKESIETLKKVMEQQIN